MLASINKFTNKIKGKNAKEIKQIIVKRLFPLFFYIEYYLYEEENQTSFSVSSKLNKTRFMCFFNFNEFEKYIEDEEVALLDFDLNFIQNMFINEAKAFCALVERQLVHVTWVALNEKAKSVVEPWPMNIDWDTEACWGTAQTNPEFRRTGLYSCVHAEIVEYLRKIGLKKNIFTVKKSNFPSNQAMSVFHPKVFADGYYIKFMFWHVRWSIKR